MSSSVRLLIVGMHNSPHLHRWAMMISRPDASILVFPSLGFACALPAGFNYIDLDDVTPDVPPGRWVVTPTDTRSPYEDETNRMWGYQPWKHSFVDIKMLSSPEELGQCIARFSPQIVHGMETQIAGYLCAETARRIGLDFPPWIQSTWGSDLFLFRKLPGHLPRLANVLGRVQVHLADCTRDRALARSLGYKGPAMPIIPASGGMDIAGISALNRVPPSRRNVIMLKGYHNWAGRGLLGLSALVMAKKELSGFTFRILSADKVAADWAHAIRATTGLDVEPLSYTMEHHEALISLSEARVVIATSISDGLPTTMLESMTVGAFPVQSSSGSASEWIEHGRTGLIVSPHNTREIADAIIRAALDDDLVDRAAALNLETVRRRWDVAANGVLAWRIYNSVLDCRPCPEQAPPFSKRVRIAATRGARLPSQLKNHPHRRVQERFSRSRKTQTHEH